MSSRAPRPTRRVRRAGAVATVGLAVVAAPMAVTLTLAPQASANPAGTALVISEVYGSGGNSGAAYDTDYVELYNPTDAAVDTSGMSVQYRSAGGTSDPTGVITLTGSVPAGGHFLVGGATGSTGAAIPTPDVSDTGVNLSGSSGTVFLADQDTALSAPPTGGGADESHVVDLVGYGSSNTWEGPTGSSSTAPAPSATTSITRSATGADTDVNSADFTTSDGSPEASGGGGTAPPSQPTPATIEQIQGSGAQSPLVGDPVVTQGVVTAAYPTGGYDGFYLQAPGTGGAVDLSTHDTSDAVFVYLGYDAPASAYPSIGDHVSVTGTVSEYAGLTEVNADDDGVQPLSGAVSDPTPARVTYPSTDASRESLEGMLIQPRGHYTVTDNYDLNQYAEIGLARGRRPLPQPTDVARPGAAADAVAARNATRLVTLDDGASLSFLTSAQDTPLPYLTPTRSVRVGASAVFTRPVILDYRNDLWKFEPTRQLTGGPDGNAADVAPAVFSDTRTAAPQAVGGDLSVASFNVLNFFTETGADYVADGGTCSYYDDRDGHPITVRSCNGDGPRGAADDANLARQRAKIVTAINGLGADVLSLEEIENSAKYAGPNRRDDALASLVTALNRAAGSTVWAYVPSPAPADQPPLDEQDVIRTAFIYKTAAVQPVGGSHILTGSAAFADARQPLAQAFRPAGGTDAQTFLVIVNHFKSKGSGVDDGTGQGLANPDRVAQAKALVSFADQQKRLAGTDTVFLTGDFNAYTKEDPLRVLRRAGYTDIGSAKAPDEYTYQFGGTVGSLDHVLADSSALALVTGAHVWNINSVEPVAYEYSRYNTNVTDFYRPDQFRSSDHDPLLVGFDAPAAPAATTLTARVVPTPVVVRDTRPEVVARVDADGSPATGGTITVTSGDTVLGTGAVQDGRARVRLPAFTRPGEEELGLAYSGADGFAASSTTLSLTVVKATPDLLVDVQPPVIHRKNTHPRLVVSLTAVHHRVRGYVEVRQDGDLLGFAKLEDGRATVVLPPFARRGAHTVLVRYLGSRLDEPVSRRTTIAVQR